MGAMAYGAFVDVDVSAGDQIGFIGLNGRHLDHFAIDARTQGNIRNQGLTREGWVSHGHGYMAKFEVYEGGDWYKQNSENDSKQNAKHIGSCLRCSSS